MNHRTRQLTLVISLIYLPATVYSLMCYRCTTNENPSCGMYFKPYQFTAVRCMGPNYKCALQREPPKNDGWVSIARDCYLTGTLKGVNESNGCKNWTTQDFTAQFCFCDTNYCNSGSNFLINGLFIAAISMIYILFLKL